MSSAERARVATKAGWFADARHEAGVIFDAAGAPVLTYVAVRRRRGRPGQLRRHPPGGAGPRRDGPRDFLDAVDRLAGAAARARRRPRYRPSNGG